MLLARVDAVESRDDSNIALETVVNLRLRLRDILHRVEPFLLLSSQEAGKGARVAEAEFRRQRLDGFEVESSDGRSECGVAEDEDTEEGEGDEPAEADSGEARGDRSSGDGWQWPVAQGGRKE